jgi:hypothetical protein
MIEISVVFVYIAIATWTAWLADRRGRSFWVYFIFCLVVPGVVLIVVPYLLVFTRRRRTA